MDGFRLRKKELKKVIPKSMQKQEERLTLNFPWHRPQRPGQACSGTKGDLLRNTPDCPWQDKVHSWGSLPSRSPDPVEMDSLSLNNLSPDFGARTNAA